MTRRVQLLGAPPAHSEWVEDPVDTNVHHAIRKSVRGTFMASSARVLHDPGLRPLGVLKLCCAAHLHSGVQFRLARTCAEASCRGCTSGMVSCAVPFPEGALKAQHPHQARHMPRNRLKSDLVHVADTGWKTAPCI